MIVNLNATLLLASVQILARANIATQQIRQLALRRNATLAENAFWVEEGFYAVYY